LGDFLQTYGHSVPSEHACVALWHTHPQKYICKYKKLANFCEVIFLYLRKAEKEFDKLTFGNSELVKHVACIINILQS
jgi:hypothetical protein